MKRSSARLNAKKRVHDEKAVLKHSGDEYHEGETHIEKDDESNFEELYEATLARPELILLKANNPFVYDCVISRFLLPVPDLGTIRLKTSVDRLKCHIALHDAILKETGRIWSNSAHMEILDILRSLLCDDSSDLAMEHNTIESLPYVCLVGYDVFWDCSADKMTHSSHFYIDAETGQIKEL